MTDRVWSRRDLEERITVLRERYDGDEFAAAVARFSDELSEEEQADLREIILERMRERALRNPALDERFERGGWLRRRFDRLERRRFRS